MLCAVPASNVVVFLLYFAFRIFVYFMRFLWSYVEHTLHIHFLSRVTGCHNPEYLPKKEDTLLLLPILAVFTSGGDHSISPSLTVSLN